MLRATILGLLLFAASASAQSSPADLVQRLGSGSFAQRERAGKELDRLGELALPALEAATRGGDVETQRRAASLLHRIEERTLAAALLKPTPTRFQFKDETIRSALRQIEMKTALKLRWPDEEWTRRKITVDTGTLPFWQAWAAFCKQAGVREVSLARRFLLRADEVNTIHLSNEKEADSALDDARHALRVRFVPLTPPVPKPGVAYFGCEILAEPRLDLFDISLLALDSINPNDPVASKDTLHDFTERRLTKMLARPSGAFQIAGPHKTKIVGKPEEIDGKFTARFVRKQTALQIDRIADAVGTTFTGWSGVSVNVQSATFTEAGELSLKLHVAKLDHLRDAELGPATTRTRSGVVTLLGPADIALAQLELHDATGKPLVREKATYVEKGDGYQLHLVYVAPPKGDVALTLSCQRIVAVPVTFRAVPE